MGEAAWRRAETSDLGNKGKWVYKRGRELSSIGTNIEWLWLFLTGPSYQRKLDQVTFSQKPTYRKVCIKLTTAPKLAIVLRVELKTP